MSHGPLAISGFISGRITNCFLTCIGSLILHPGDFGDQVKLRVAQNLCAFSLLIRVLRTSSPPPLPGTKSQSTKHTQRCLVLWVQHNCYGNSMRLRDGPSIDLGGRENQNGSA